MPNSTLETIRVKVRRLTRSPSPQQISDAEIDEYVNTFVVHDMPAHIRLFNMRKTFSFYTQPNIDTYATNTVLADNPLFNFKNAIMTTHTPIYAAGYKVWFSQSREEFFGKWPMVKQKRQIATGNGLLTNFTGTLANKPILPNELMFTSIDANDMATGLVAVPLIDDLTGIQTQYGNLYDTVGPIPSTSPFITQSIPINSINYVTGVFNITFTEAPAANKPIYVQDVPYSTGRPTSILYFNNTFTIRPVPDMQYDIKIEAYVPPSELLAIDSRPDLDQWWQYIAYGAAKKVFEDRTDIDSIQSLMPEFMKQEKLVLRTTLVQQGDDRAPTIYSDQSSLSAGPWGWWNGSN